jgi:hypothetical protein
MSLRAAGRSPAEAGCACQQRPEAPARPLREVRRSMPAPPLLRELLDRPVGLVKQHELADLLAPLDLRRKPLGVLLARERALTLRRAVAGHIPADPVPPIWKLRDPHAARPAPRSIATSSSAKALETRPAREPAKTARRSEAPCATEHAALLPPRESLGLDTQARADPVRARSPARSRGRSATATDLSAPPPQAAKDRSRPCLVLQCSALALSPLVVVVIARFARQFAVFAGSGGGLAAR